MSENFTKSTLDHNNGAMYLDDAPLDQTASCDAASTLDNISLEEVAAGEQVVDHSYLNASDIGTTRESLSEAVYDVDKMQD